MLYLANMMPGNEDMIRHVTCDGEAVLNIDMQAREENHEQALLTRRGHRNQYDQLPTPRHIIFPTTTPNKKDDTMSKTTELLKTAFWALNILPNQEIDAYKAEVGNIKDTYHLANLIEEHLKELNKQPPADSPEAIDNLAQIIRQVDGNHDKGAAELAEAILNKMWASTGTKNPAYPDY